MKKFNFIFLILLLLFVGSVSANSVCDLDDEWEYRYKTCSNEVLIGTDVNVGQCLALCQYEDTTCCHHHKETPYYTCWIGDEIVTDGTSAEHSGTCEIIEEGDEISTITSSSSSMITLNSVRLTGVFAYNDFNVDAYFYLDDVKQTETEYTGTGTETFNFDIVGLTNVTTYNYTFCIYANATEYCDTTKEFTTTNIGGTPFVYDSDNDSIDNMFDSLDTDESWAKLIGGFLIVIATIFISVVSFGKSKVEYGAYGFLIFTLIGVLIATTFGLFPAYILVIFLILGLLAIIMNKVFGGND